MVEFTETKDDRVEIRLDGEISAEDVAHVVEALRYRLAIKERIDLLAELVAPEFSTEALEAGLLQLPVFERLGQVAIIADPEWWDVLGEVEDMLLPGIDIRCFAPSEPESAHTWLDSAAEEASSPVPVGVATEIPTGDPHVIAFEVRGRLTLEVLSPLIAAIRQSLEQGEGARVLLRLGPLVGFDSGLLLDPSPETSTLAVVREVERYAIVGGPPRITRLLRLLRPVFAGEVRSFESRDEARAWEWLGVRSEGSA